MSVSNDNKISVNAIIFGRPAPPLPAQGSWIMGMGGLIPALDNFFNFADNTFRPFDVGICPVDITASSTPRVFVPKLIILDDNAKADYNMKDNRDPVIDVQFMTQNMQLKNAALTTNLSVYHIKGFWRK